MVYRWCLMPEEEEKEWDVDLFEPPIATVKV
jgi:hypothetical protein